MNFNMTHNMYWRLHFKNYYHIFQEPKSWPSKKSDCYDKNVICKNNFVTDEYLHKQYIDHESHGWKLVNCLSYGLQDSETGTPSWDLY